MKLFITPSTFILCFLFLIPNHTRAQYCTEDSRFSNVDFFTGQQIDSSMNLNYATAPDQQGNPEDLAMNIYYPKFIEDTMPKRPFIMLIHGGGYVSGDRSQLNSLCRVFAQRGFVTATITHRFGPGRTISTLYRAHQDAEAAMRYIAFYADSFRVDTAHMFMGGFSSGSNIAFDVIYTDEDEWLSIDPDFVNDFGGLYTTGNSLPNSFRVKGMFNNWGSAFLPAFDTTETVPMISFHGERDPIINIDVDSSIFRGGSRALHNFLTQSGQCSDLTVDPNGSHGVYNSQEGVVFRLNRTSCFFKSILCNSCSSSSSTEPIPPDCSGSTTTSIQDLSNFLTVYPNPFSDRIQVEGLMGDEKFTLLNSLGTVLYEGKNIDQFSTTRLTPGIYFLRIGSGQSILTQKLIKQN